MAHQVICPICKQKFDRDKVEYVIYSSRRYAHATCALREAEKLPNKPQLKIIDPTEIVLCDYCRKEISKKDDNCICVREGHYAHKTCFEIEQKRELTDEEKLNKYITERMFNLSFVPPLIQKQIKQYINDYHYSYSGMLKALIYGVEISHKLKPDPSFPTLGYLPYIYQEAYNYYYSLWLAEQSNAQKNIAIPIVEEIKIVSPQRKIREKQRFLDIFEDEINGE